MNNISESYDYIIHNIGDNDPKTFIASYLNESSLTEKEKTEVLNLLAADYNI